MSHSLKLPKHELNFSFIIISPEHNFARVQGTIRSIKNRYDPETPIVCVVGDDTGPAELKELKEICPTYRGNNTITSLLNTGIKKGKQTWKILLMEGTLIRSRLDKKYARWAQGEKDVLYPLVCDYNRDGIPIKIYNKFEEATLNGLCLHQKTFKEIGDFSDNPIEISKTFWALEAKEKGIQFKAILGAKVC